jgi:ribose transport system substrate-binding protein
MESVTLDWAFGRSGVQALGEPVLGAGGTPALLLDEGAASLRTNLPLKGTRNTGWKPVPWADEITGWKPVPLRTSMLASIRTSLVIALALGLCWFAGCSPGPRVAQGNAPNGASTPGPGSTGGEVVMPEPPPIPKSVIPSRKPERPLTVGVSLLTRAHKFYQDLEAAMREEAPKHRLTLKILSADFDASRQLQQVQTFLTQNVDALVLCPVDSQGSGSAVALANEQKVPVFTADIASKTGDVVCHVASNNDQGGMLVGEFLGKALDGKGEVAVIDFPVVSSVQERVRGFEKAIARYPGIRVVQKAAVKEAVKAEAFTRAQDLLQTHPTLKGVFGINDDCALGVVQAASATGREELVVVGFDATPEAIEYIRQGSVLKADASQFPAVIGRTVINAVARHALGEPVPRSVPIPTALVTRKGAGQP